MRDGGREKGESGETGGDEGRQNYRGEERRGETNYLILCAVECHVFVCVCVLLCACVHGAAYYSTNTGVNLLLPLLLPPPLPLLLLIGKVPSGITEFPFEFAVVPTDGASQLFETYHGVYVEEKEALIGSY